MADSVQQLSEILGEIYNKVHHLFPTKTGSKILDWLVELETITYSETELSTLDVLYPIYWAPNFEWSDPFQWDEQWGATSWGAYDDARYVNWDDGVWHYDTPSSEDAFLWGKPSWGTKTWIAKSISNWS